MRRIRVWTSIAVLLLAATATLHAQAPKPTPPARPGTLPSEMPEKFVPVTKSWDYDRRVVDIPMRDGVKLHTVILVPKTAAKGGAGLLLTRTPYDAETLTSHVTSAHLGPMLYGYDNATDVIVEDGYIRVFQDVRGKYGSEGDYVINRPLRGPLNPSNVDHATDTWDTIDWLVKNVPESNGRVGTIGISYNGFLPLMSLFNPHPALKCSVPMNPMVDGWIGDDWFHNGAFRQQGMGFIYNQQATRKNEILWWTDAYDDYDTYMAAVNAGELGRSRGMEQLGFWRQILAHPSYDAYWREQAVDKLLAKEPLKVPVMLVHSLWDQEDIYGAPAVYRAIEPKDTGNDKVFLAMGPWHHGQMIWEGSALGAIKFDSDTSKTFRQTYLRPFLAQHLKGGPKADIPPVAAFETGTNVWRHYPAWPVAPKGTPLYLAAGGKLGFAAPASGDAALRRVRVGSRAARALHPSPRSRDELRQGRELEEMAGLGSAGGVRPAGRRGLRVGGPEGAGQDRRGARGEPRRLDVGYRFRLGRQADRRLSAGGPRRSRDGRIPAHGRRGHLPRPVPREPRGSEGDHAGRAASRTSSRCRPPTTSSSPATGSWCRSSRAGSRSTTATRRPSCRTSSGRSPRTTGRPRSGSTPGASSSCRWRRGSRRVGVRRRP